MDFEGIINNLAKTASGDFCYKRYRKLSGHSTQSKRDLSCDLVDGQKQCVVVGKRQVINIVSHLLIL